MSSLTSSISNASNGSTSSSSHIQLNALNVATSTPNTTNTSTMTNMTNVSNIQLPSCKVCFQPYGVEKNRAYCILPCCHTFCDECISKLIDPNRHCPSCRSQITETKVNWELHETVSQLAFEALNQKAEKFLSDFKKIKEACKMLYERKYELHVNGILKLRKTINRKAEEAMSKIFEEQKQLLSDVDTIELGLLRKVDSILFWQDRIEYKLERMIERLNTKELKEKEFDDMKNSLETNLSLFKNSSKFIEQDKFEYSVDTNDSDNQYLGKIIKQQKSSKRVAINESGLSKSLSFSYVHLPSLNSNLNAEFLVRSTSSISNIKASKLNEA